MHPEDTFSAADLAMWRARDAGSADEARRLLLDALRRSHEDPTLAKVLPTFIANAALLLEWDGVLDEAKRVGLGPELGLFVELAGDLSGRGELAQRTAGLSPRTGVLVSYFPVHSRYELRLAELNTPAAARRWGFLMNMGLDAFQSAFEKHHAAL